MSGQIYAIGDIHGQKAQLDRALALIAADGGPDAEIVFLGDYTDRGPDSCGVLETLIAGRAAGRPWHMIRGNHDQMFLDFITQGIENSPRVKSGLSWLNERLGGHSTLASYGVAGAPAFLNPANGGWQTLESYHVGDRRIPADELRARAAAAVPDSHRAFLSGLPLHHRAPGLLFVHAGLRPGIPLDRQDPHDLMWIRDGWLDDPRDHGALVVHGHTALDHPRHHGNRVNLDGGAGYGRPLIPAVFEDGACFLLTDAGRVPLLPSRDPV